MQVSGKSAAIVLDLQQVCRYLGFMHGSIAAKRRYSAQREKRTPPHVSLKTLRTVLNLTLHEVAQRVGEITGDTPTKGALSAIENGHRGISGELLAALEQAYGLDPGCITTTYKPRTSPALAEDVA